MTLHAGCRETTTYIPAINDLAARAMPKPVVDLDKCTGCGTCASSCPQGVLEVKEGKAQVVNPDACIGCRVCESVCPAGAIKVTD